MTAVSDTQHGLVTGMWTFEQMELPPQYSARNKPKATIKNIPIKDLERARHVLVHSPKHQPLVLRDESGVLVFSSKKPAQTAAALFRDALYDYVRYAYPRCKAKEYFFALSWRVAPEEYWPAVSISQKGRHNLRRSDLLRSRRNGGGVYAQQG